MSSKHCLIVENSEIVRRVTMHMLKALSFDVAEVTDGNDAIVACAAEMPDAIILDWTIAPHRGLDCLEALRQLPGGDRPFIFYSMTELDGSEWQRARDAGANDVLVKPYDRELLRNKLVAAGLM